VSDRPAYGGICYSNIPISSTHTAIVYNSVGSTTQQLWFPSTTGVQAYAHPIDGFAGSAPTIGCPSVAQSSPASSSTNARPASATSNGTSQPVGPETNTPASQEVKRTSGGTIAGAVVGSIFGLVAVIGLVFFLLRRRRTHQPLHDKQVHELTNSTKEHQSTGIYELKGSRAIAELDTPKLVPELP